MKMGYYPSILLVLFLSLFFTINSRAELPKSLSLMKVKAGGIDRKFYIHSPVLSAAEQKLNKSIPLIIGLHGGGSSVNDFIRDAKQGFIKIANRENVLIVYPEGIEKHWNDGNRSCCGTGKCRLRSENIDDVGFISDIINFMIHGHNADKSRVYICGVSAGGLMAYRLALEIPEQIAAIGVVASTMHIDHELMTTRLKTKRPVSVMLMNGTADKVMPWEGGQLAAFLKFGMLKPTPWTVNYWCIHNGCKTPTKRIDLPNKHWFDGCRAYKEVYKGGREDTEVVLFGLEGGGHTWPDGAKSPVQFLVGRVCRDVNGCEEFWSFFKRHKRAF